MNWDALGALSELVGAAGVIITLAYLAIQLRENNKMMRATAKQDMADQTKNMTFFLFDHPGFMSHVLEEADLTAEEQIQMMLYARGLFRVWESYCYSREIGLFDDLEWHAFTNTIVRMMKFRAYRDMYEDMRNEFSPRLHAVLDPLQQA